MWKLDSEHNFEILEISNKIFLTNRRGTTFKNNVWYLKYFAKRLEIYKISFDLYQAHPFNNGTLSLLPTILTINIAS